MLKKILVTFALIVSIHLNFVAADCFPPASAMQTGSFLIQSPGCSGTQDLGTYHCHCWSKCVYICDPKPTTTTTTAAPVPGTCQSKNANGPATLPSGARWLAFPGCGAAGQGEVLYLDDTNERCQCFASCGYICKPIPSG